MCKNINRVFVIFAMLCYDFLQVENIMWAWFYGFISDVSFTLSVT